VTFALLVCPCSVYICGYYGLHVCTGDMCSSTSLVRSNASIDCERLSNEHAGLFGTGGRVGCAPPCLVDVVSSGCGS
jgi:hypothetical protein